MVPANDPNPPPMDCVTDRCPKNSVARFFVILFVARLFSFFSSCVFFWSLLTLAVYFSFGSFSTINFLWCIVLVPQISPFMVLVIYMAVQLRQDPLQWSTVDESTTNLGNDYFWWSSLHGSGTCWRQWYDPGSFGPSSELVSYRAKRPLHILEIGGPIQASMHLVHQHSSWPFWPHFCDLGMPNWTRMIFVFFLLMSLNSSLSSRWLELWHPTDLTDVDAKMMASTPSSSQTSRSPTSCAALVMPSERSQYGASVNFRYVMTQALSKMWPLAAPPWSVGLTNKWPERCFSCWLYFHLLFPHVLLAAWSELFIWAGVLNFESFGSFPWCLLRGSFIASFNLVLA